MTHYHDYIRVSENSQGIVEVCKTCKKRLVTKKDKKGRIDNNLYRQEHEADFSQPTGRTANIFKQVYGKK